MQRNFVYTTVIVTVLFAIGLLLFMFVPERVQAPIDDVDTQDLSQGEVTLPYGNVTLQIGKKATFEDVELSVVSLEEESRCPADVQCIQAGTVRVQLLLVSGLGTSTPVIALGETITTEAEEVTFLAAAPSPVSTTRVSDSEYVLTFAVEKRESSSVAPAPVVAEPSTPAVPVKSCFVGGCSSQLCSDTPGMASTCEYREVYACYRTALCEVQSDGECGWTQSPELEACLLQNR